MSARKCRHENVGTMAGIKMKGKKYRAKIELLYLPCHIHNKLYLAGNNYIIKYLAGRTVVW